MLLNPESMKPIYVQIAEWLEGEILSGNIREEERIYSQYQLADMFDINPATAAKGLNLLADNNIVYKKRGLGMFVSPQAQEIVRQKRQDTILKQLVFDLVCEAERLRVSEDCLAEMIKEAREQLKEEEQ